jgi:hypothetical protein
MVPVAPPGPLDLPDAIDHILRDMNRGVTFGFLLGYLSLAVYGTLEYPRYARYYVGPWVEPAAPVGTNTVEYWTKKVARHLAYSSEMAIGTIAAVISDGPVEPTWIYRKLGDDDPTAEPPRRVTVRRRIPRVDLILRPEPGCAEDLHAFAHEVSERFTRQLD